MKFGVVVFPGSNCDADCLHAIKTVTGQPVEYIWHKSGSVDGFDCIVLPGGFSYGDYLRCGAIARFSPVMTPIIKFAQKGGLVIGICNGFQILTEAGLLPGALHRNNNLKFICKDSFLRVENNQTPFTCQAGARAVIKVPIAHGEGNYYADQETLNALEENGQVVFRYCDANGEITPAANPNGSVNNIAGICNKQGNVLGMMPHPERCAEAVLGNTDGQVIFKSLLEYWQRRCG
ncbi:Phosphoribosylformylglycinamidine synthase 1 [Desulfotomaculum nigrificans CO-1-SRB]|uniref:Phosphoribosylformylglycinamidine synthase subunit PurQ n=1 Tax=Desulfotomaculum nigrificans (strain DSM 14880 / VKM B-2319 / CO-1-SRB) TaxID=868595 RepID=F6B7W8_DESCC|nr:phosphoribosylformylglycinamidine synthase subunit PurQ [Desulfotomaculum nigrificans]AEF94605.1 Phosphoribosylformylglycinamidine synthase 1 [Desulfotomaculum nigrificans CO-1-SRB]